MPPKAAVRLCIQAHDRHDVAGAKCCHRGVAIVSGLSCLTWIQVDAKQNQSHESKPPDAPWAGRVGRDERSAGGGAEMNAGDRSPAGRLATV
jgi:hypothetical protein